MVRVYIYMCVSDLCPLWGLGFHMSVRCSSFRANIKYEYALWVAMTPCRLVLVVLWQAL
jgi:hypothetical protein